MSEGCSLVVRASHCGGFSRGRARLSSAGPVAVAHELKLFHGDLPEPGIELASVTSPALAGGFFTTNATWEALIPLYLQSDN